MLPGVSIILDKWDSAKCTCPYFARSTSDLALHHLNQSEHLCISVHRLPGPSWWASVKHDILQQHVLGVLVHGRPRHRAFLYTFNDSIKGDANCNIEGIRQTLAALYSDKPMPPTTALQVRRWWHGPVQAIRTKPNLTELN